MISLLEVPRGWALCGPRLHPHYTRPQLALPLPQSQGPALALLDTAHSPWQAQEAASFYR